MKPSGNSAWTTGMVITATRLNNAENALKSLEALGSVPASSLQGRLVLVTSDGRVYRDSGSSVDALALLEDARVARMRASFS